MMHDRRVNADGFKRAISDPGAWPRWARIAFVVLWPVAVPLYAAATFVVFLIIAVVTALATFVYLACTGVDEWQQFLSKDAP